MNSKEILNIGQELGFVQTVDAIKREICVGTLDGFPVMLSFFGKNPITSTTTANFGIYFNREVDTRELLRVMKKKLKGYPVKLAPQIHPIYQQEYQSQAVSLIFKFKKKHQKPTETIKNVWLIVKEVMQDQNIKPRYLCPVCGESQCDGMYFDKMQLRPVHNHCKTRLIEKTEEKFIDDSTKSQFIAYLMMVFGVFFGAIPTVIGITFFKIESNIFYMIIPGLGAYLFKKFKGKGGLQPLALLVILSIAGVIGAVVTANYLYYEQVISPLIILEISFATMGNFFDFYGFALMMSLLGLVYAFAMIGKTPQKEQEDEINAITNIFPYNANY